jgi:hypothetical protein
MVRYTILQGIHISCRQRGGERRAHQTTEQRLHQPAGGTLNNREYARQQDEGTPANSWIQQTTGGVPDNRGRTQRHAVSAKVRVFVRNPDELANEKAKLARLLNKTGTCFLHEMSLSTASGGIPDNRGYTRKL